MTEKRNYRLNQAAEWLNKEIEKDKKQISNDKEKYIKEITSVPKEEMIDKIKKSKEKKRLTFFERISIIFGYGKKG